MLTSRSTAKFGLRVRRGTIATAGMLTAAVLLSGCAGGPVNVDDAIDQSRQQDASASAAPSATVDPSVLEAHPAYMTVGEASAPNTITVYSDYLCPHCAVFATEIEPKLVKEYVESGKAKIEYRDFIVIDKRASTMLAVYARMIGAETGDYRKIHELLMSNQEQLLAGSTLNVELLIDLGKQAGAADAEATLTAASEESNGEGVLASHRDGRSLGVKGTPSVAVNGKLLVSEDLNNIGDFIK